MIKLDDLLPKGFELGKIYSNPLARAFNPLKEEEIPGEEYSKIKEEDSEDHEVSMAQNQLDSIIKHATELKKKMGEEEKQIPAWIQDHITNSENYISQAASNYHEYGDSNESVNEGRYDSDLDKIETAVKNASSFMGVGAELKKAGIKYTFATEMIPMYMIKVSGNTIAIVNKKYAAGAERTVKDIAIGLLERKINEEFKHIISVETPTQVVSKPIAKQIEDLAKKGVRSKDIGLKMGFVGNQKVATDAFQKLKNQIYFKLNKTESVNEGLSKDSIVRTLTSDKNAYFLTKDGNGWILDITPKGAQNSTFHQKFTVKDMGKGHLGMKYKLSESINEVGKLVYRINKPSVEQFIKKYPKIKEVMKAIISKNGDVMKGYKAFLKFKDKNESYLGGRPERTDSKNFGSKIFYKYDWNGVGGWAEVYEYLYDTQNESVNEVVYDIGSGWMGNGLTIWNRAEEEHGDYKIIAHIDDNGKLSVRDKNLPNQLKKMFQIWADSMKKGNKGPKY